MKTKQTKIVKMNRTSDFWGTQEGVEVVVKREYFYNGEFHTKGIRLDNNEIVNLPSIFFN